MNLAGLGYRQQRALAALRTSGRPCPSGYIARAVDADAKMTHVALLGLCKRGLVRHVRHGYWEAA